jgi:ABC-type lipoprotein release transport system permease subunit
MSALSYKMLLRKRGTVSAILAVALLVAIPASMNSIMNHINSQAEALGESRNVGGTYLILSRNSTSMTDSKIDAELTSLLNNVSDLKYALPQRILTATLTTEYGNHTIFIRFVEDINTFLKMRRARVNGTAAKSTTEANVGEILARKAAINLEDEVKITMGSDALRVDVVGVFRTQTQADVELIVSMEAASQLAESKGTISLIEFTLQENVSREEALNRITELLPENVELVKAQQLKEFMQAMTQQTLTFLNLLSLTVYAVVAAASYVIATRLTAESSYELAMLRALGGKKRRLFTLVLAYTATTALIGSIPGVTLGIAGAQAASTILRWIQPSFELTPFLEAGQAFQTLLFTLASSTLGGLYPALKSTRTRYTERLL